MNHFHLSIQATCLLFLLLHTSKHASSFSYLSINHSQPSQKKKTIHRMKNNIDEYLNRRTILTQIPWILLSSFSIPKTNFIANAAPPVSVIAEELGYFPVQNRNGDTTYIPSRVKRKSTDQAIQLATYLQKEGAVMYGAFWCPHCQRQKEMFGREAWEMITYVECDKKGYQGNASKCFKEGIEGFPTWKFKSGKEASGEMPLAQLASVSGFKGSFDASLEPDLPVSSGSCR